MKCCCICHSIFIPNNDGFSVLLLRFSDFLHRDYQFHSIANQDVQQRQPFFESSRPKILTLLSGSFSYRNIERSYVHIARVIISTHYKTRFHSRVPPVLFASSHPCQKHWDVIFIQNKEGNISVHVILRRLNVTIFAVEKQ